MIKWCAFCQRFQGQIPPFERMQLTHGLCPRCAKLGLHWSVEQERRIEYLGDLASKFWKAGVTRDIGELKNIIDDAVKNRIRPIDLLFGLAGPSLTKVGDLWAKNLLTIQEEHAFTKTCERFIEMIRNRVQLNPRTSRDSEENSSPRILLATIPGNEHTLGLRFTQLGLLSIGLTCEIMDDAHSIEEILERAKKIHATTVGFSISMVEQMPMLLEAMKRFGHSDLNVKILLAGGRAISEGLIDQRSLPKNVKLLSLVFDESERALFTEDSQPHAA